MTPHIGIRWNAYQDMIERAVTHSDETGGLVVEYQAGGILYQVHCHVPNVHNSPAHNYAGQAQATIHAFESMDVFPNASLAFEWHSHPTTSAVPSRVDKEIYHAARYLCIVSTAGDHPELTMWDTHTWDEVSCVTF